jgi:hypothetical protein
MERVRRVGPRQRGSRWLRVLLWVMAASASVGFVGGAGAHGTARIGPGGNVALGRLVGGIYKVGGPAPPYGCYHERCPTAGRVTVRNQSGAVVARERLIRARQRFHFRLIPGRYTVNARCGGHGVPKSVHVVAEHTTRANLYCGIR